MANMRCEYANTLRKQCTLPKYSNLDFEIVLFVALISSLLFVSVYNLFRYLTINTVFF